MLGKYQDNSAHYYRIFGFADEPANTDFTDANYFSRIKCAIETMSADLIASLEGHDRFFAKVIDLIPAELYKHTVSEDADGAVYAKYAMVCCKYLII